MPPPSSPGSPLAKTLCPWDGNEHHTPRDAMERASHYSLMPFFDPHQCCTLSRYLVLQVEIRVDADLSEDCKNCQVSTSDASLEPVKPLKVHFSIKSSGSRSSLAMDSLYGRRRLSRVFDQRRLCLIGSSLEVDEPRNPQSFYNKLMSDSRLQIWD